MRGRGRGGTVGAVLVAALLPCAATAHAHHPGVVQVGEMRFSPAEIEVRAGEQVVWSWTGPDTNHTVTSEPGQAEAFDSDPGRPATAVLHSRGHAFTRTFSTPGEHRYLCRVHPSMRGVVRVSDRPDGTPPQLTALRVPTRARRALVIRVRSSEAATVYVDLARAGRTVQRRRTLRAGANRLRLPVARLPRGRYRVTVQAVDEALNASRIARRTVTLVR